jgi:hypothetical protein
MADYIVVLKDSEEETAEAGRHAFYQQGVARNAAFRELLCQFLRDQGMADQVSEIREPTVFPLIALRCTPEVAKLIKGLPGVDEVVRDFDGMSTLA